MTHTCTGIHTDITHNTMPGMSRAVLQVAFPSCTNSTKAHVIERSDPVFGTQASFTVLSPSQSHLVTDTTGGREQLFSSGKAGSDTECVSVKRLREGGLSKPRAPGPRWNQRARLFQTLCSLEISVCFTRSSE